MCWDLVLCNLGLCKQFPQYVTFSVSVLAKGSNSIIGKQLLATNTVKIIVHFNDHVFKY